MQNQKEDVPIMEDISKPIAQQITNDNELHETIRLCLKKSPMWNNLVSTVELEVIKLFEDRAIINTSNKKPQQPDIVKLINKLISEYMEWMGYKLTYSMFTKESGTELKMKNDRKQITSLLDLEDNHETIRLPLLTVLITMFINKNGDKEALDD